MTLTFLPCLDANSTELAICVKDLRLFVQWVLEYHFGEWNRHSSTSLNCYYLTRAYLEPSVRSWKGSNCCCCWVCLELF